MPVPGPPGGIQTHRPIARPKNASRGTMAPGA